MKITEHAVLRVLDACYDRALKGVAGTGSYEDLAREYQGGSLDHFVSWQTMKCAASGFAAGLGGFLTLPIAIPADMATNFYVQLRMIAVIAHLHGHDPRSDKVKSLAFACLLGNQAKEVLKDVGIEMSRRVAHKIVERAAHRGLSNLGRIVPLFGGVVGGTIDAVACQAIARVAKKVFENPPGKAS